MEKANPNIPDDLIEKGKQIGRDIKEAGGLNAYDMSFLKLPETDAKMHSPIIIQVKNLLDNPVANLEIFDCLKRAWGQPFVDGSLIIPGKLEIRSGIPGITYEDILLTIATGTNYIFGVTVFQCQKSYPDNYKMRMDVETRDLSGRVARVPIVTKIDPAQIQKSIFQFKQPYAIDKLTSLRIEEVPADETITILLYPAEIENA